MTKKEFKLYFVDLDGTTLDTKKDLDYWVSNENLEAISEARKQGKEVIVSTGRVDKGAEKFVKLIGGKYSIQSNGAVIVDENGNKILEHKLTLQQQFKLLEIIMKYKLAYKVNDGLVAYGAFSKLTKFTSKKFGFKPIEGYYHEMHKEYYKFVIWGKISKRKIKKIENEILAKIPGVAAVSSAGGFNIEVTSDQATKGIAAEYVANLLNINKEDTAHLGDSMNDSTTKNHVGALIAMGNADKNLKVMADFIGPKHKVGGVAKILKGQFKENKKMQG